MGDNKKILTITLAALIILNIFIYFNLRDLRNQMESQINNLNSQVMSLNNQMSSQSGYINQALNKFKEDRKWTGSGNYKLLEFDSKTGRVKVQINWSFRELPPNSKVYLSFGEKELKSGNVGGWDKVEATSMGNLNYKSEVYLSPDKNYKIKAQSESNAGAKGEDLMDVDLVSAIKDRFSLVPAMDGRLGPRYEHHIYVINKSEGADFLKIKSAKAQVYVKGNLENTIELHKAAPGEIGKEIALKFGSGTDNEIWLNDDAIWVKGEENWVKTGENSWSNKSGKEIPRHDEIRVEVVISDNMGMTYTKSIGREN